MPLYEVRFGSSSDSELPTEWLRVDTIERARAYSRVHIAEDARVREAAESAVPPSESVTDVPSNDELMFRFASSPIIAHPLLTIVCGVILAAIISAVVSSVLHGR